MKSTSPEVDAYIAKSAEFARPILQRIRRLFHEGCPNLEETIKWGAPHFEYKGLLGCMAAFKQHVSYGFWKGQLLSDPHRLFSGTGNSGMSGAKVTQESDLPPDSVLKEYVREAAALNESGVQLPRPKRTRETKEVEVPDYFLAALKKNKRAHATFERFSYSQRKEYVEWITEAKQEATRQRRIATAIEWLAEGKSRNWKYETCRK
jgi:uncharacterized protein YdeI (YjbR/CyaY-like superfamily)